MNRELGGMSGVDGVAPLPGPRTLRMGRAEALLKRAEAAAGSYTSAAGEYYFDGYLQDPVKLLALRHDIAQTLEVLARDRPTRDGRRP